VTPYEVPGLSGLELWHGVSTATDRQFRRNDPMGPVAFVKQKKAKASKRTRQDAGAPTAREGSKKATVLELIRRADGASVREIMPYASHCTSLA